MATWLWSSSKLLRSQNKGEVMLSFIYFNTIILNYKEEAMGREEYRSMKGMINNSINRMINVIARDFDANAEKLEEECPLWSRFLSVIPRDFDTKDIVHVHFIGLIRQAIESKYEDKLEDKCEELLSSNTEPSVALLVLSDEEHDRSICTLSSVNTLMITETLTEFEFNKELKRLLIDWVLVAYPQLQMMDKVESFKLETVTDLIYLARMYVTNKILPKMYRNDDLDSYQTFEDILDNVLISLRREQLDAFLELFKEAEICQDNLDIILNKKVDEDRIDKYRAYMRIAQQYLVTGIVTTKFVEDADKQHNQITSLETKLASSGRKLEKARRNLETERNKIKELEKKLSAKPKSNTISEEELKEFKELKKTNVDLLNKIAKLKSRIDSLSNNKQEEIEEVEETSETIICEKDVQEEEETPPCLEQKLEFIKGFNIVVIGGPPNFSNKIRQFLPKARVIDKTTKYNEIKVGNADAVFIYSKIVGHSRVAKIESIIKDGRAKSYYVSSTNKELFCDEVYKLLANN